MEFLEGSDAVGYFLLATATVKLLLWFKEIRLSSYALPRHLQGNGEKVLVGRVSKLFVYPVKSMSGIEVTEMRCKAEGPSIGRFSDREFLLTSGDNHVFVTARQVPRTLLIHTAVDGNTLKLAADGMSDISINIDRVEEQQDIRSTAVHGMATVGLDCGDDVGRWLDEFLGPAGYRLIYASSSTEKRSVAKATEKYEEWAAYIPLSHKMNYQDTSPVHLLSEASVEDLNTRITNPITMRNFRPNILVSGAEPYAEDTWNRVFIGETEMSLVKLCGRCVFTTINPVTAEKSPAIEPLKTMRRFRKLVPKFGDSPCFGVNLNPERLGMIKVGDPVYAVIGSVRIEP